MSLSTSARFNTIFTLAMSYVFSMFEISLLLIFYVLYLHNEYAAIDVPNGSLVCPETFHKVL
jgi:hypothetical protein